MSRFCIIILARANHFFPLEKGFHQLFMRLERNMRARSKGKNHQDNYTKTTSLKFVFTAKGETCDMFEDSCSGHRHEFSNKGLSQAQICSKFHVYHHRHNNLHWLVRLSV